MSRRRDAVSFEQFWLGATVAPQIQVRQFFSSGFFLKAD